MSKFIPGLRLSRLFYQKEVKPILDKEFPSLRYSAAVIGWGSEVLGFDTPISRDHHWGPRVAFILEREGLSKAERQNQQSFIPCFALRVYGIFNQVSPSPKNHYLRSSIVTRDRTTISKHSRSTSAVK
jgi:hypothetical protein